MKGAITLGLPVLPVTQTQEVDFYLEQFDDDSVTLMVRLPTGLTQEILRVGSEGISRADWLSPYLTIEREGGDPTGPVAIVQ